MMSAMDSVNADTESSSRRRRLVIVADNSLIVEAIRLGFRSSGEFVCVGHADGRKTSAATILAAQPDVILVDDMNRSERALELIRTIRAEAPGVSRSVIVLSVQLDQEWLEQLFEAGATGAISKATQPVVLATLVRETVNGRIFRVLPPRSRAAEQFSASPWGENLPLTRRELEILRLVAAGATNGDVASRLWVTEQTVKFHLRNVYRKLGVANRTQAGHFAYVNGLMQQQQESPVAGAPQLTAA